MPTVWRNYATGDPIHMLYNKLKATHEALRTKNWDSSPLHTQLYDVKRDRLAILSRIEESLTNFALILEENETHARYTVLSYQEYLWLKQRVLQHFDDDLHFLFSSVKVRSNSNLIRMLHTTRGPITHAKDIAAEFCSYYETLFNGTFICCIAHDIPSNNIISSTNCLDLGVMVTDSKILNALKCINENKSHGADEFNSKFLIKF